MTRPPRGTGYCKACGRRILLTANGRLILHTNKPDEDKPENRPRCPGAMTHHYEPGPDRTETP